MPIPPTITWAPVGDVHADAADGWQGPERLSAIVADVNGRVGRGIDRVFLTGDNANRGQAEEDARILAALAPPNAHGGAPS